MFSKLKSPTTHLPVFKGVGLAVPSRTFPPDRFSEKEVDIVVGTATALETILTSKRTLGFNFNYAVFDEVHNLNGEEGGALERIIRLIDCPFLALSATIKNVSKFKKRMESVCITYMESTVVIVIVNFYSSISLLMPCMEVTVFQTQPQTQCILTLYFSLL